jgi:hypothetical protein
MRIVVAPQQRQGAVLDQIKPPVFTLFETGPLKDRCSFLTYEDIRDIAAKPDLSHMKDSLIEDYEVYAQ